MIVTTENSPRRGSLRGLIARKLDSLPEVDVGTEASKEELIAVIGDLVGFLYFLHSNTPRWKTGEPPRSGLYVVNLAREDKHQTWMAYWDRQAKKWFQGKIDPRLKDESVTASMTPFPPFFEVVEYLPLPGPECSFSVTGSYPHREDGR